ncbi:hypothetical protein KR067_004632 [Drosophila pandora]|nr:hypothetical protein KR067_004632 [Drosophila pandora]
MFRNQYDSDTTVWSPQGRLFQVEYAMEAVKQGSATVGLKSRDYAALIALCRTSKEAEDSPNSPLQRKIMPVDAHMGMSIAGLTADARIVCQHLRSECMSYRHSYDTDYPVQRLVTNLGTKLQATTQRYNRRPFGVGMLIAGYDEKGTHIFQVMPSANVFNCKAMAIGSRSQSARTYLERHLDSFMDSTKQDLICHGIQAIRGALGNQDSSEFTINVAIVGKDEPFKIFNETENQIYFEIAKTMGNPVTSDAEDARSIGGMIDMMDDMLEHGPSGSGSGPALDTDEESNAGLEPRPQ